MSRSLSRIRNLISEIEEIHRQGQQGVPAGAKSAKETETVVTATTDVSPATVSPVPVAAPIATQTLTAPPVSVEESDPFLALANLVHLDEKRDEKRATKNEPVQEGRVHLKFSGSLSLTLEIENTGEIVEVRQIGKTLEIRFADGKAFHLPLKAVA